MTTYISDNELGSVQMMPDELNYLVNQIKKLPDDAKIVEWGSGGSTFEWLRIKKNTQKLVSIEHDLKWSKIVSEHILNQHNYTLVFADVSSPYFYHEYGTASEENPFNTQDYVNPKNINIFDADFYIIDGIARGACLASTLLNRTKKQSRIFLHDYTTRLMSYSWITQYYKISQVGTTLIEIEEG